MMEFKCDFCGSLFYRYKSQVTGKVKTCSTECRSSILKTIFKGKCNPNYKNGVHSEISFCVCGKIKDYRAEKCSVCSKCSVPKQKEYIKTDAEIIEAIAKFTSFYDVAKEIGVSRKRVREIQNVYKCDISHFCSCKERPLGVDKVFSVSKKRINGILRKYILQYELIEYKCEKCGQNDEWQGMPLTLQLDHKDGNSCNNVLTNLRWLCPNCHTQTDTFCGRKR